MPKIVDKEARRNEIIATTWRIISERGFEGVTLREVAAAGGYAHGALKPYFTSKDELLRACYLRAFDVTLLRAAKSIGAKRGIEALRLHCYEVMPLNETTQLEAAVVVAFWGRALGAPELAGLFQEHQETQLRLMRRYLRQAQLDGERRRGPDDAVILSELLWMMVGLQALAVFTPDDTSARRQKAVLERILGSLVTPSA